MTTPPAPLSDIVVVGGGTAGWMAAATLARFLERGYRVRLVESDEIATVGVGEATIPQIRLFLAGLGLDENAFLKSAGGTFKLGIQFVDWLRKGESYYHTFAQAGPGLGLLEFHHYWLRARAEGWAGPLDAYSLMAASAKARRFTRGPSTPGSNLPPLAYAFHIDATLLARSLRAYAEARGVERREGRVVEVEHDGARIAAVKLASGERVAGDLFLDCSGFRALLIGEALGVGYEDWTRWLPCDRALAVPSERAAAMTPYTRATASSAGWRWRIPLQHRTGNGYVYASRFISDEDAAAELLAGLDTPACDAPRPLKFRTGKRETFWKGNCIALGLASGFMEPLESTSIHMVQSGLARLMGFWPDKGFAEADVAAYNAATHYEYDRIRDFLVLHYKATARDDTAFWRHCRDMEVPPTLQEKLDLFAARGRVKRDQDELFTEASWTQVMLGQGVTPNGFHPLARLLEPGELREFLGGVKALTDQEVARMPTHDDYVARNCAM